MPSRTAEHASGGTSHAAAMTPEERVALAVRLGEEGLRPYMLTHRLDRPGLTRAWRELLAGAKP
jgi:hypothetical protein